MRSVQKNGIKYIASKILKKIKKAVDKSLIILYSMYCSKEHKKQTEQYNECDSGSVGRVRPCQGRGRGFEPRLSLLKETDTEVSVFFALKDSSYSWI